MKRIVVKVGSSVLSKRNGHLNMAVISNLVCDLAKLNKEEDLEVALVSSGAVSVGRSVKSLEEIKIETEAVNYDKEIVKEQILAAVGQPKLMAFYTKEFDKFRVDCAQILATRAAFADRQSYLSIRTVTNNLLKAGILPIFNENDVLSPEELDFSDNDQLACMVAAMLMTDKLIILTDVDGMYDGPIRNKSSKVISMIEDASKYLGKVDKRRGTGKGGMRSKLLSADLVTCLGMDMHIASGFKKNILSQIVQGERIGTFLPARNKKLKPIKNWLATAAVSGGRIIVSTFIADMLKKKKTASVLFTGVEKIEGNFNKGDVIEICNENKELLAKGMVKYSSEELYKKIREYAEKDSDEKDQIKASKIIAVHYDYMVFC